MSSDSDFCVKVPDCAGNTVTLKQYDGEYVPVQIPGDPIKAFQTIKEAPLEPDDIILVEYPKSGVHWVWEMVHMMYQGNTENQTNILAPIELVPDYIENMPSPRVLPTHLRWKYLPQILLLNKNKIIHLMRDPRDLVVSYYHFMKKVTYVEYDGTWDSYFTSFLEGPIMYGTWFDFMLDWEKVESENPDHPIIVVSYEELHKDCFAQLKRLAGFLGLMCTDELLTAIVDKCRYNRLKADKEKNENDIQIMKMLSKDGDNIMFRKGVVGDWKNTFTVAQSEKFAAVFAEKMKGSKYETLLSQYDSVCG